MALETLVRAFAFYFASPLWALCLFYCHVFKNIKVQNEHTSCSPFLLSP